MQLFYRKYGFGHPLIIVHGLYGTADNWVTVAKALSAYFEVFVIDQRNHGRSPHSPGHNYNLMKSDLLEFMDEHNLQKAILIGHSMGGKTVMHFAASYPERVSSLIVLDIAPKSYKENDNYETQAKQHRQLIDVMKSISFTGITDRKVLEEQLLSKISDKKIGFFLLKNIHRNKNGSFSWLLNINALDFNLENILEGAEVTVDSIDGKITGFPVLFVRGALSNYIQDSDFELIRKLFPYADIETLPNAGHWLHAEQPELLIKKIKEFILN